MALEMFSVINENIGDETIWSLENDEINGEQSDSSKVIWKAHDWAAEHSFGREALSLVL